ncbi:pyrimidine 5'-nucleotidase, partial [Vibrio amylolyticus]
MKYDWILFDADETLFHFDAFKGMQLMFSRKGVDFTEQDFDVYQQVNKPLWVDYQNGDITAHQLKHTRFESWAERLNTT